MALVPGEEGRETQAPQHTRLCSAVEGQGSMVLEGGEQHLLSPLVLAVKVQANTSSPCTWPPLLPGLGPG